MSSLLLFAPLFFVFEIAQLVLGERYLGIKQIARGADPRSLGLSEVMAFFWSSALIVYWLWMLALLAWPFGRMHGLGLLAVSAVGYAVRRGTSLKWILVTLTFEGAIRIGLLISLATFTWRQL